MRRLRITYAIVCLAWLTCACQDNTKFHQYQPVKQTGWCSIDTLTFHLPSKMDCGEYDLQVGIRHTEKYAYQDIWLEMTCANDSATFTKDTLHLYLATKDGEWSGKGCDNKTHGGKKETPRGSRKFYRNRGRRS